MMGMMLYPAQAKAAIASTDSQVLVYHDVTATSSCSRTFKKLVGKNWVTLSKSTCEIGTVLSSEYIPLSTAIALHQPYVQIPPKTATRQQQILFEKQANDLTIKIRSTLRSTLSTQRSIFQYATCATEWYENNTEWYPGLDFIDSVVYYQVTSCSNLSLYDSVTQMIYFDGGWLGAMASGLAYSSGFWDFCDDPNNPLLNYNGDSYTHILGGNTTFGQGYYVVAYVADPPKNGGCQSPGGAGVNSVDIGPLA